MKRVQRGRETEDRDWAEGGGGDIQKTPNKTNNQLTQNKPRDIHHYVFLQCSRRHTRQKYRMPEDPDDIGYRRSWADDSLPISEQSYDNKVAMQESIRHLENGKDNGKDNNAFNDETLQCRPVHNQANTDDVSTGRGIRSQANTDDVSTGRGIRSQANTDDVSTGRGIRSQANKVQVDGYIYSQSNINKVQVDRFISSPI